MTGPFTAFTGRMHDRCATPLTCTVQAPHRAMPQPNFVPVSPTTSRSTQSRGICGGTSTEYDLPLTESDTAMTVSFLVT